MKRKRKHNPVWQPWGRVSEAPAAQAAAVGGPEAATSLVGQLMWTLPGQEWEHEPAMDERRFVFGEYGA